MSQTFQHIYLVGKRLYYCSSIIHLSYLIMTTIYLLTKMLVGIWLNITSNYQKLMNQIMVNFQSVAYINVTNYIRNLYFTLFPYCGKGILQIIFQYSRHRHYHISCSVMLFSKGNNLTYLQQKFIYPQCNMYEKHCHIYLQVELVP